MLRLILLFALWSGLCVAPAAQAAVTDLYNEALAAHLDQHPVWLKLLHIDSADTGNRHSAIHSPEFFLAANGRDSPRAELLATLAGLVQPSAGNNNLHTQCRFPARRLWLISQLPTLAKQLPTLNCNLFEQWSLGEKLSSVSIVFATGYLGNPASYYGHTLLKFNSIQASTGVKLLDVSVNYGAIVPDGDDPLTYIAKGLTGGYEAGFTHIQYYFHTHNYGENEFRDMWEYQLDLPPAETRLIVAHAWEVLGKKYTYYFVSKNCALRMAELLEIIPGINVTPPTPWVIPQQFIKTLSTATYHNQPLVNRVSYVPSRQSRLYAKHRQLSPRQQQLVKKLSENPQQLDDNPLINLPLQNQHQILDTLLDYYQFATPARAEENTPAHRNYQRVLAQRFASPPGISFADPVTPLQPGQGRNASLLQAGIVNSDVHGNGLRLRHRPTYYDPLDADAGHVPHAELTMADIDLVVYADQVRLQHANIISIQSLQDYFTGLEGDSNRAWKLRAGWESAAAECENHCLQAKVQGDMGYSWRLSDRLLSGIYVGAAAQENRQDQGHFYGKSSAFLAADLSPEWRLRLDIERRHYVESEDKTLTIKTLALRYQPISVDDWDLRIEYLHEEQTQIALSAGFYW